MEKEQFFWLTRSQVMALTSESEREIAAENGMCLA